MSAKHISCLILFALLAVTNAGCQKFPELEVSEAQFDGKTPYPEFVPIEELLIEPEATITSEVETDLTTRRDTLQETPEGADAEDAGDPVLDRIDALRERRDNEATNDPIIDDALRKRLEGGINPPTIAE